MARYNLKVTVLVFNNNGIYGGKFESDPNCAFPKARATYVARVFWLLLCLGWVEADRAGSRLTVLIHPNHQTPRH